MNTKTCQEARPQDQGRIQELIKQYEARIQERVVAGYKPSSEDSSFGLAALKRFYNLRSSADPAFIDAALNGRLKP